MHHLAYATCAAQTGVVRTLPVFVQRAYRFIMGNLLLTPAQVLALLGCALPVSSTQPHEMLRQLRDA